MRSLLLLILCALLSCALRINSEANSESIQLRERVDHTRQIILTVVACGSPGSLHISLLKRLILSIARSKAHHDRIKLYIFYDPSQIANTRVPSSLLCPTNATTSELLLQRLHHRHKLSIQFLPVPSDLRFLNIFKRCATVKLWLPDLLPNVTRVINLDTDMLVLQSLQELWEEFDSFDERQLLGLTDEAYWGSSWYSYHKRYKPGRFGVNTGTFLFNLERARRMNSTRIFTDILTASPPPSDFYLGDQDVINVFLAHHPLLYRTINCRWNRRVAKEDNCRGGDLALSPGILHGNRDILYSHEFPDDNSTALHRAAYSMFSQLLVRDALWCTPTVDAAPGSWAADFKTPVVNSTEFFDDGKLVRAASQKEVFFMEKGFRRSFPNAATFFAKNLDFGDVMVIPDDMLESIPLGAELPDVKKRKNLR